MMREIGMIKLMVVSPFLAENTSVRASLDLGPKTPRIGGPYRNADS
jgi:hypothetical protein